MFLKYKWFAFYQYGTFRWKLYNIVSLTHTVVYFKQGLNLYETHYFKVILGESKYKNHFAILEVFQRNFHEIV